MELREWLPLVISGVLGLAGIVAGLWGTLATLRAQRQRGDRESAERAAEAERSAAERERAAKRELEAAQRAHLLDERRSAYTELARAVLPWMEKVGRRISPYRPDGDDGGPVGRADPAWGETERAVAMVRLVAPRPIGEDARRLYMRLKNAESDTLDASMEYEFKADSVRDADRAYNALLKAMNADLLQPGD